MDQTNLCENMLSSRVNLIIFASGVLGSISIARSSHHCSIKYKDKDERVSEHRSVNTHVNEQSIGKAHPSTLLPEFAGCIYLDYNATSPIFPEISAVSKLRGN
jgi:hypothetical protein